MVRGRAALLRAPEHALLSHASAAQLWVPSWPRSSEVHLSFSRSVKAMGEGIRTHRFRYRMERWTRHGLAVTGPAMTFIHLAVWLDLVDLVSFGDRLAARDAISPTELVQAALAWDGHGRRAAITAARLVRERSESVPETQSRLLMVWAGLPEPVCNHPYLVCGVERFRLDLAWVVTSSRSSTTGAGTTLPSSVGRMRPDAGRCAQLAGSSSSSAPRISTVTRTTSCIGGRGPAREGCPVEVSSSYQRWFQPRGRIV